MLNKLDMVDADQRAAIVKDFVKRFKFKGPVFEISALTREGCEQLVKTIYKHVKEVQKSEQPAEEIDPRFAELAPEASTLSGSVEPETGERMEPPKKARKPKKL